MKTSEKVASAVIVFATVMFGIGLIYLKLQRFGDDTFTLENMLTSEFAIIILVTLVVVGALSFFFIRKEERE